MEKDREEEKLLKAKKLLEELIIKKDDLDGIRKNAMEKRESRALRLKTEVEEIVVPSLKSIKEQKDPNALH